MAQAEPDFEPEDLIQATSDPDPERELYDDQDIVSLQPTNQPKGRAFFSENQKISRFCQKETGFSMGFTSIFDFQSSKLRKKKVYLSDFFFREFAD